MEYKNKQKINNIENDKIIKKYIIKMIYIRQ